MELHWDIVFDGYGESVKRLKVPGGWLVRWHKFSMAYNAEQGRDTATAGAGGMTFYPDPEHAWDGNSLP